MTDLHHDLSSVTVTRVYPVPPARVFAALSSREAMVVWANPDPSFRTSFESWDFRVGGRGLMRMQPPEGDPWINEDRYHEIVPDRRIILTSSLNYRGMLMFAGVLVYTITSEGTATRLTIDEHGCFPDGRDKAEHHRLGWTQILEQLAAYLEG
jgi:uncharacterized protein YndB with AHSA1/START domain